MNVMTPRHWEEVDIFGWRPKLKPLSGGYLAIVARTRSMSRAPDENLRLRKGQGCAGMLWERNGQIAWAILNSRAVAEEHNLSEEQIAVTEHVKAVVSCAVFSGRGDERDLIGVLNLDAPTVEAINCWWDAGSGNVKPEVQDRLRSMAEEISERGYLPI